MSSNNRPTLTLDGLKKLNASVAPIAGRVSHQPPRESSKPSLLTPTALRYLELAHEKAANPKHPNFVRAISKKQRAIYRNIEHAADAVATKFEADGIRKVIIGTLMALKADATLFVTYIKDLCADAAFAAHMDCVGLTRTIDPATFDEGLDAMAEDDSNARPVTSDLPAFDAAEAARAAPSEDYEGTEPPRTIYASDLEDAYEAINGIQAWLDLAISKMPEESREYWQLTSGIPFGQERVETYNERLDATEVEYVAITDFDRYREWQDESFKAKRREVKVDMDLTDALMAS